MFDRYDGAGGYAADLIIKSLKEIGAKPSSILEVGCGGGHLLSLLRQEFDSVCFGLDPSAKAIQHGRENYPDIDLQPGTAESLAHPDGSFDLVIFGFCLYVCDPCDHFRIAWQADRVLRDQGFLVVSDFCTPFPYRNDYAHFSGMFSYKMDWSRMFTWNPAYRLISRRHIEFVMPRSFSRDDQICIDVLRKDRAGAFPTNPYH